MPYNAENIRNFSIIAHIDHGKSTLADRIIQACEAVETREMKEQLLDNMDIERERGITIKSQTVCLKYTAKNGEQYIFNLMDTPGHVDFSYEVSRCLAACEGSLLVVDAAQGVEAQTLANVYQAIDNDHEIIPVLNKIDLPAAEPERVKQEIEDVIGIDCSDAIEISAKTGLNIESVLEAIAERLPAPSNHNPSSANHNSAISTSTITKPELGIAPQALLVDSWYDKYLGVIILTRVFAGEIKKGIKIKMLSNNAEYEVDDVGIFTPKKISKQSLQVGEVGYINASIKNASDCSVGDTITNAKNPCSQALAGFKPNLPVVFCGLFPIDASDFDELKDSLAKLHLNDASFEFEQETSLALGLGFRCGFLGLLHLEIIQERLEREYGLTLITTAPSVVYKITMKKAKKWQEDEQIELHNPADMPDSFYIKKIEEPWIVATIFVPEEYLGGVLKLCQDKRGVQQKMEYNTAGRVMLQYDLPLNEVVFDFYDRLKSITSGYASFDWEMNGYKQGDLVKVNIMVNNETVDALALITHRSFAEQRGRALCNRLKGLIPRQLFRIALQAAIGGKIIARETISAMRKDVTAKCYGGDITRKRKLLEKQKKGKKKMRMIGNVEIPQSAFLAALKTGDD